MSETLLSLDSISVRDEWTARMFRHITRGRLDPPVTPDPVFAFNQNASGLIPSRARILEKYELPERYIALSFVDAISVDDDWIGSFSEEAAKQGYGCALLPMPKGGCHGRIGSVRRIGLPLPPLDWYAIIKHSSGYVGHNMHPMIVAIHNRVPFFIYDYYGVVKLGVLVNRRSSKIFDILSRCGLLRQRVGDAGKIRSRRKPAEVLAALLSLRDDPAALDAASESKAREYRGMMDKLLGKLGHADA
jgi:hypothetical protein